MNCDEALGLIRDYFRGTLKTQEAAAFAEHICGCKSCKDELEISYCLRTAIRQLNEEEEFSGDYIAELNQMLLDTIKEAKREKKMIYRKRIFVIIELVLIAYIMGMRVC